MNTFEYASGTVATMRKSAKGATQPRKKVRYMGEGTVTDVTMEILKVYEQALMVRKVKTYLAELKVSYLLFRTMVIIVVPYAQFIELISKYDALK